MLQEAPNTMLALSWGLRVDRAAEIRSGMQASRPGRVRRNRPVLPRLRRAMLAG